MEEHIGRNRTARHSFGFDDVAIVPGAVTLDPELVDVSWEAEGRKFNLPVMAAAMDAVVNPRICGLLGELGAIAVLNLLGLQTRYENPEEAIEEIIQSPAEKAVETIQRVYSKPVSEDLVGTRVEQAKVSGGPVAVSCTPTAAPRMAEIIGPGRLDILVVQSTVTTARHISDRYKPPSIKKLAELLGAPVMVGNCVTYEAAIELMQEGASGILVGVGPGAQCTTRRVLGIGVPQITAICDAAAARDDFQKSSGCRVAIVADGGMRVGGDISKAIAAGADAVMLGSSLAMSQEAPGKGYQWGMSTGDPLLPRGARIVVGTAGTLKEILLGPSKREDGSMNLIGALRLAMATCGARSIAEMQKTELVIAPSLLTEGKAEQRIQKVGHGKD
jgi:IMP dehydrogenase